MPFDTTSTSQTFAPMVMVAIVLLVLVLRNQRARPLRVELLWVRPVLLLALFGFGALREPIAPTPLNLTVLIASAVIGAVVGWQRGRFMRIEVHPETHDITSRASPLGIIFILVLVVVRIGMRGAIAGGGAIGGVPAAAAADALIALAAGMMMTQSLEMWLRARRLLAEAIAARSAPPQRGTPIVR